MVMFHTMPYAEAQRRGAIQEEILNDLTANVDRVEDVDFAKAETLIRKRL
jgi:kynurenine 3-monooxygenase